MRLAPLAVALSFVTGCSTIAGKWVGQCDFGDARYGYSSALTVQINDGGGSAVNGDVELDMWDGQHFEGQFDGVKSDTYIEMEALFAQETPEVKTYTFKMTGDITEDVIEGECGLGVPNGVGYLAGTLLLER